MMLPKNRCVDYWKLNKVTAFDLELIVAIGELFQKLSGDKYFIKIDLSKWWVLADTDS